MIRQIGVFLAFFAICFGEKKICLNMIVKNEKDVIERCLSSARPLFDTWAIVDTGSTDGTQEVIKNALKDVPGTLYERPWVNFGVNRQEALMLAKEKGDYILFMDADDILTFAEDFKRPELTSNFYSIKSCVENNETWFQRLVKADLDWYWEGAIHEDLFCKTACSGEALQGVKYIYLHDGARAKDPNTALKDIEILKKEIERDSRHPRNYFYLARSYLVAGQPEKALEAYRQRAELQGNEEEVFNSLLTAGILESMLGRDSNVIQASLLKAYFNRPHRVEPLYYLGAVFCQNQEFEKAYQVLKLSQKLPRDIADCMWIEKWIYEYGVTAQLSLCAQMTGRLEEGIELCQLLMKTSNLPDPLRAEVAARYEALQQKNVKHVQDAVAKIAL